MNTKLSLVISIVLVVAFFTLAQAAAYSLYSYAWPTASATYDTHTLSSSWRSAVAYGCNRWEYVSDFDWRADNGSANDVYLDAIDGKYGVLATTTTWRYGDWMTKMRIRFDSGETWYTGSSSPGTSRLDARSEAAHECGHALGIAHTQGSRCSSSVSESRRPTMCSGYKYGKTWKRSLEDDDENAVGAQYDSVLAAPSLDAQRAGLGAVSSVDTDISYVELSPRERVEVADYIIHGSVTDVSPTRWNQDSGLYWEETVADDEGETTYAALPYYEITVAIEDVPIAFRKVGQTIRLTVLGMSPLDSGENELAPFSGDEVFFYARATELAWRGGETRKVITPVGNPNTSILMRDADGLFRELASPAGEGTSLEILTDEALDLRSADE